MLGRLARLFVIKTRFEAMAVTYALAVGAVTRGSHYLVEYPGVGGWLLLAACTGSVFMAGARLMEMTRRDSGQRRRRLDLDGDWSNAEAALVMERRLRCAALRATSENQRPR